MNNMANFFKTTSQQDVTHVPAGNNVKAVSSWSHNFGAMTKQTSGKTGRKRNDSIVDLFKIDPTSLIDDNARQHKKPKVTSVGNSTKPDAIDIGVSFETQMEDVISEPSLCYPKNQNVPHIFDLQSKHSVLGTHTMVSNNEDLTLSVSTRGLHLIVRNIVKEKLFCKHKFFDKRKHGSYSTKSNTVCGMLIKLGNISAMEADYKCWDTMRSPVMRTHTDHRNNCIKAMRLCFRGTCTFCDIKQDPCAILFLSTKLVSLQNVLFQIAMQTMRITKHYTEGLTFPICSKCARIWCITSNSLICMPLVWCPNVHGTMRLICQHIVAPIIAFLSGAIN
jgi:hypothetical protein